MTDIDKVMAAIRSELERATQLHPSPMHSTHEAYGVILEELDEAWDEVKGNRDGRFADEVVQTAAMCARAIIDLDLVWRVEDT